MAPLLLYCFSVRLFSISINLIFIYINIVDMEKRAYLFYLSIKQYFHFLVYVCILPPSFLLSKIITSSHLLQIASQNNGYVFLFCFALLCFFLARAHDMCSIYLRTQCKHYLSFPSFIILYWHFWMDGWISVLFCVLTWQKWGLYETIAKYHSIIIYLHPTAHKTTKFFYHKNAINRSSNPVPSMYCYCTSPIESEFCIPLREQKLLTAVLVALSVGCNEDINIV